MTKTVVLSVTCAVALVIPGLAGAQDHNPFSNSYTSPFADFDPTPSPAPWPEMPPIYQPYQAPAQTDDPYAASRRYRERMDAIDRRQREQANLWRRYAPQRDPLVEYYERRDQDRHNAIQSCLGYDRNPAARSACLEAIR